MGKSKLTNSKKRNMCVHKFGTKIFKTDGKILFYNPCEKSISCDQRFQVGLNNKQNIPGVFLLLNTLNQYWIVIKEHIQKYLFKT